MSGTCPPANSGWMSKRLPAQVRDDQGQGEDSGGYQEGGQEGQHGLPRHRPGPRGRGDRLARRRPAGDQGPGAPGALRGDHQGSGARRPWRSRRDRRPQGERAAGPPHPRPAGGLQGQPDPLAEHPDGSVGRAGPDGGAPAASWSGSGRSGRSSRVEYWSIEALCAKGGPGLRGRAGPKIDGHKPQLSSEARRTQSWRASRAAVHRLQGGEEAAAKRPGGPFTTSTLQQEAAKKLGFSARRTMRAAQDLYEGMDVGRRGAGRPHHLHADRLGPGVGRGDGATSASFIGKQLRKGVPPRHAQRVQLQGGAGAGGPRGDPADRRRAAVPSRCRSYLEPDQFRLYQLIWQRFVASQMNPAIYDMTIVDFDLGGYLFRATGSVPVFDGYHKVYTEGREAEEGKTMDDLPPIPRSQGGRPGRGLRDPTPNQHFTEPPPRFSEASLVKELERLGIGRPSTYARSSARCRRGNTSAGSATLLPHRTGRDGGEDDGRQVPRHLQRRVHLRRWRTSWTGSRSGSSSGGSVLARLLRALQPAPSRRSNRALVMPRRTGSSRRTWRRRSAPSAAPRWSCAPAGSGRTSPAVNYQTTCDYVKSLKKARAPDRPTDEKCHLCGSPMVIKTGRFGEFLACTTLPRVQGHPVHPAGHEVPQVRRRRPGRTAHQAGQVLLGLHPLPGLRLLHLEPAGAGDLPLLRLGGHGEEGQQGARGRR